MESQKLTCPNHPDKESSFYCFNHRESACLRCVSAHIQCQVDNQFLPLEEVFDSVQSDVKQLKDTIQQKLKGCSDRIKDTQNKMTILENLKPFDIQIIEAFFEDVKKKADELKEKTIKKYEASFVSLVDKVKANNSSIAKDFNKENKQHAKLVTIEEELGKALTNEEKKKKALGLYQELEKIKKENGEMAELQRLDYELDTLMSQEEVFSEIGNLTLTYSGLESKVVGFMNEHMKEYVKDGEEKIEKQEKEELQGESLDQMLKKIEYMQDENQVYEENFFKVLDGIEGGNKRKSLLHQLRFCSNEVNIFDCETGKFECYQLFMTNAYKTPFFIYNNCGSVIYKNHLVFMFGGEDPVLYDKSSNRVFCFNLDQATADKKVVVYEISAMLNERQEFTLTTIGDSIYVISGLDTNRHKENRVIPKCERLDIKSKKFTEMRDINYPRQAAASVNVNNTHIYVFGGQNPKYLDYFVDKIERYTLNLNDWSVIKFSVMNEFNYEPGIYATAFRMNTSEIVILGGKRNAELLNGYYVFDMKKLLFIKKGEKCFKEADTFENQNNVQGDEDGVVRLFSSTRANYVYEVSLKEPLSFSLEFDFKTNQIA